MTLWCALGTVGRSGTLNYNCEGQGQITHAFYAGGWRNYATVNEYLLSPGSPLPSLTADFASTKVLEFRFLAPAGMQYEVNPANPFGQNRIGVDFYSHPPVATSSYLTGTASWEWIGASEGAPETLTTFDGRWILENGSITLACSLDVTAPFSFLGFNLVCAVPEDFDAVFTDVIPYRADVYYFWKNSSTGSTTAPGQRVTLATVPEPGVLSLILLGLIAIAGRRAGGILSLVGTAASPDWLKAR